MNSRGKKHFWFVKDACGIICAVVTWCLVIYAEFVVCMVMLFPTFDKDPIYSAVNIFLFNVLAALALISHFKSMTTDPGSVPKGNASQENIKSMNLQPGQIVIKCTKCFSIKPERAHHCSVCQRCIRKMDHHCPWINNCVGETNQKFFVLFTFYIASISLHAMVMAFIHFVKCVNSNWSIGYSFTPPATIIFIVTLIFEALLFFIFTMVMFWTQMNSICENETGIEQLKNEKHWNKGTKWLNMKGVFGDKFSIAWFLPCCDPVSAKDQVYQYIV